MVVTLSYGAQSDGAKSNRAKSVVSDLLLGMKMRKAVKNCQKHGEINKFF